MGDRYSPEPVDIFHKPVDLSRKCTRQPAPPAKVDPN